MVALRLMGTHPDQKNKSADEAAKIAAEVAAAIDIPLIILGSGHVEKDTRCSRLRRGDARQELRHRQGRGGELQDRCRGGHGQ